MVSNVTSFALLKYCYNLPTMFRAQAVKKLAHRFLNISCTGRQGGELLFCLVNLKLVSRPMWIEICKKICRQILLNMDTTNDFVISPLKLDPRGSMVSIIFFHGIVMVTTLIVNATSMRKICC